MSLIDLLPFIAVGAFLLGLALLRLLLRVRVGGAPMTMTWSGAAQPVADLQLPGDGSPPAPLAPSTAVPVGPVTPEPVGDAGEGVGFAALRPEVLENRSSPTDAAPLAQVLKAADVLELLAPGTVQMSMTMDPPVVLDTLPEALAATEEWDVGHATITSAHDLGEALGGTRLYDLWLEVATGEGLRSSVEHVVLVPHESVPRIFAGASLAVRLGPDLPANVMIDWEPS
jgi:hypothetical protein